MKPELNWLAYGQPQPGNIVIVINTDYARFLAGLIAASNAKDPDLAHLATTLIDAGPYVDNLKAADGNE